MEVFSLLRSKNRCLERFLSISTTFLTELSASPFTERNWDGLTRFEQDRESMLRAIDLFDRKINELAALIRPEDRTEATKREANRVLSEKDALVELILKTDLEIMTKLDLAKTQILREANQSNKNREALSRFKSNRTPIAGEELDERL